MEQENKCPDSYVASVLARIDESNLSDSEVVRRAGIAWTTLSRIRTGKQSPTIRTMDKLEIVMNDHEADMARRQSVEAWLEEQEQ